MSAGLDPQTRIMVTGGSGFLGRHIVAELARRGYEHVTVPRSRDYDLRTPDGVQRAYADLRPQIVIHLAALAGGIGVNRANPATFFYNNLMMGSLVLEHARLAAVEKFVAIGTICSYPKHTPVPFREEDLWQGYPEETNAPYGLAKKMLLVQGQAYREQYGFNTIHLMPTNLYGPHDDFEPETSHATAALIRKYIEAKEEGQEEVVTWGTGRQNSRISLCGRRRPRHRDGYGALRRAAAGQSWHRTGDFHSGADRADCQHDRLPGPHHLGYIQARRPAAPLPRYQPRPRVVRVGGDDSAGNRATPDDCLVSTSAAVFLTPTPSRKGQD